VSAADLLRAKREAEHARRQLTATAAELQERLKPGTLASSAWAGVKDKSGEMADEAVEAVKARPLAVSAALAAFTLFLARRPIAVAASRLLADEPDENLVTTRLDGAQSEYDLTAPVAERQEGARP
jgi:hypothetical protein